jgi:hypothetical protein
MTESTLSDRLDELAESKAKSWLRAVKSAIDAALKPYYRLEQNGDEFFGEVIGAIIAEIYAKHYPSRETFDERAIDLSLVEAAYRRRILAEVLEKLPLVKELSMMGQNHVILEPTE